MPSPQPPFQPQTLDELVTLANLPLVDRFQDCKRLSKLRIPLKKLQRLAGLSQVKDVVLNQILASCRTTCHRETLHTVITGPPGTGKTTLAKSLAELYASLGVTQTSNIVMGTRQNMIAPYVGQTVERTQALIDKAKGGVLLIDEAYALGGNSRTGKLDPFSKACIDTLNQNLTEKKTEFVCIIVGYKDQLNDNFFSVNAGLRRRFNWYVHLPGYNASQMLAIFKLMCHEKGLMLTRRCVVRLRQALDERGMFPDYAGSLEVFRNILNSVYTRRTFGFVTVSLVGTRDFRQALALYKNNVVPVKNYPENLSMYY